MRSSSCRVPETGNPSVAVVPMPQYIQLSQVLTSFQVRMAPSRVFFSFPVWHINQSTGNATSRSTGLTT